MPPIVRRALALSLLCLAVCALPSCARESSAPPGRLEELLALVPASVARERALYYSDLRLVRGFSSALPLTASGQVLGAPVDAFTDVLESGGRPLTLLAGDIDAEAVGRAVRAQGYRAEQGEDWLRFERDGDVPPGAPPLVRAVPAGAVRDGVLVLGSSEDVGAVVRGGQPPPWARPLAETVGSAAAIAFDGRPAPYAEAARRRGTDVDGLLEQHRVPGFLAPYEAAAISWHPRGEFDGMSAAAGVVALVGPPGRDGGEQAAALAIRAATAPILGVRRGMSDIVEGGAPRFDDDLGTVHLPVRWVDFDASQMRRDLDGGALLFLAPGGQAR
jgi:hypothetical protein